MEPIWLFFQSHKNANESWQPMFQKKPGFCQQANPGSNLRASTACTPGSCFFIYTADETLYRHFVGLVWGFRNHAKYLINNNKFHLSVTIFLSVWLMEIFNLSSVNCIGCGASHLPNEKVPLIFPFWDILDRKVFKSTMQNGRQRHRESTSSFGIMSSVSELVEGLHQPCHRQNAVHRAQGG